MYKVTHIVSLHGITHQTVDQTKRPMVMQMKTLSICPDRTFVLYRLVGHEETGKTLHVPCTWLKLKRKQNESQIIHEKVWRLSIINHP